MTLTLLRRRVLWWPTWLGWTVLLAVAAAPVALWWTGAERFLSASEPVRAEVLVVEGWIGPEGVGAAAREFRRGGYQYIVATGGLSGERESRRRWSYTAEAREELLQLGLPTDRVVAAEARDVRINRTYESAIAVQHALAARQLDRLALDVFTLGVHARRSRLVFTKVCTDAAAVGVIAWKPREYANERWWQSSDRCDDLLKETVGYLLERFFDSGRSVGKTASTPS